MCLPDRLETESFLVFAFAVKKMEEELRDVLLERRVSSDVVWASREWNPASAYVRPRKSGATEIKSAVLHSYRLRRVVNEVRKKEKSSWIRFPKPCLKKTFWFSDQRRRKDRAGRVVQKSGKHIE